MVASFPGPPSALYVHTILRMTFAPRYRKAEGGQRTRKRSQPDFLPDWGRSDRGRRLFDLGDGAATPKRRKQLKVRTGEL